MSVYKNIKGNKRSSVENWSEFYVTPSGQGASMIYNPYNGGGHPASPVIKGLRAGANVSLRDLFGEKAHYRVITNERRLL